MHHIHHYKKYYPAWMRHEDIYSDNLFLHLFRHDFNSDEYERNITADVHKLDMWQDGPQLLRTKAFRGWAKFVCRSANDDLVKYNIAVH